MERTVDAAALERELHDAWLDFGSLELTGGTLTLTGDRDFAVDEQGRYRRGRFSWRARIEGVEAVAHDDPDEIGGIVVCTVESDAKRLSFIGCTPGRLVVDGHRAIRLRSSPHRLPKRRRRSYQSSAPNADPFVEAVAATVRSRLAPYGPGAAAVAVTWSPRASMWFVEVDPSSAGAAPVAIGVTDDELVVTLPNSHFEIGRTKRGPVPLEVLARDLEAIFDGRVEEAGYGRDRPVRLSYVDGTVKRAGALRLPLPWHWRPSITYPPYSNTRGDRART
jgi:hypothetical protein